MEGDRPGAAVGDRIGQEKRLDLAFGEIPPCTASNSGTKIFANTGELAIIPATFGTMPKICWSFSAAPWILRARGRLSEPQRWTSVRSLAS